MTYRIYSPDKFKAEYEAELAAKKAAKKAMTTVQVEEKGEVVEKKVNRYELNKMRMAQARELDAAKYADDRTTPLTRPRRRPSRPRRPPRKAAAESKAETGTKRGARTPPE